jgi:outer membrane receptor for ferrienterochelin and colicins
MKLPLISSNTFIVCFGLFFSLFSDDSDSILIKKESPDSLKTLDKMVITATRTNRLISQTPASVGVISQEEIEISPAKNMDDLIMKETGVQVRRVVGIGEGVPSDIIIRGIPGSFGSSRTLILVDGIPTNVSGTPFLILNEIPLGAIKSIEIVRGPFSSLYGANAFGGVVNILTQSGYGKPGFKGYFETSYPFTVGHKYFVNKKSITSSLRESGKETYYNIEGSSSGGNEKFNYFASAGFRNIGNYLLKDYALSEGPYKTTHLKNENYDYRDVRFFGKCGVTLGEKAELELHTRFFNSDLGYGKTRKIKPDSSDIVIKGTKFVIGPAVNLAVNENVNILSKAYYRTLAGEFWNEEPFTDTVYVPGYWRSQQHDWQVESQGIFTIGKSQVLTSGIEYLGNFIHFGGKKNTLTDSIIPGSDSTDKMITNVALYLQDEISLFNRLNIVPGLRLDYHSDFGSALSPKLGISFQIVDWLRIRSSIGRAFRAPTLSELYMPDLKIRYDFLLIPNPDLSPEYMWAVDGAFEITPLPTLKFQAGLFYNDMKDLIVPQLDTTDLLEIMNDSTRYPGITHVNIDSAWAGGLEFEIEWQAAPWLIFISNYVLQITKNERAKEVRKLFKDDKKLTKSQLEVPLDYVPNQTCDIGLNIRKKLGKLLFEATMTESYIGKRKYQEWTEMDSTCLKTILGDDGFEFYIDPPLLPLESYWRTDIVLKCTINENFWFACNIQNLFDKEFRESGRTLATGRFASIKIGVEF